MSDLNARASFLQKRLASFAADPQPDAETLEIVRSAMECENIAPHQLTTAAVRRILKQSYRNKQLHQVFESLLVNSAAELSVPVMLRPSTHTTNSDSGAVDEKLCARIRAFEGKPLAALLLSLSHSFSEFTTLLCNAEVLECVADLLTRSNMLTASNIDALRQVVAAYDESVWSANATSDYAFWTGHCNDLVPRPCAFCAKLGY